MAVTTKLSLTFAKETGGSTTMSYKYAKSSVTPAQTKALMNAIIANKAIFAAAPSAAKSAKLVQTDVTDIDIS